MAEVTSLGAAVDFLQRRLSTAISVPVQLGNLAEAEGQVSAGESLVNLLVYRVEPDGAVLSHNDPDEPWQVRLHVLVTPFSGEEQPSVGLNDLHVLGNVAGFFHHNPVLPMTELADRDVVLHVVPEALSVETLNQLWSVQGEVGFRPSVAYEVALVPVKMPDHDPVRFPQPLVGDVRSSVGTPASVPVLVAGPRTGEGRADLRFTGPFDDDATPRGSMTAEQAEAMALRTSGRLQVFERDGAALGAFTARVTIVADRPSFRLVWELRTGEDDVVRLAPDPDPGEVQAFVGRRLDESVDPATHPGVQVHDVPLPATASLPAAGAFQLVLRAVAVPDPAPDGTVPPVDVLTAPLVPGRPVLVSVFDPAVA